MHGGAKGSGAPLGNHNARKTGLHTREMIQYRREVGDLLRASRKTLCDLE
jgi:hypothetical protein